MKLGLLAIALACLAAAPVHAEPGSDLLPEYGADEEKVPKLGDLHDGEVVVDDEGFGPPPEAKIYKRDVEDDVVVDDGGFHPPFELYKRDVHPDDTTVSKHPKFQKLAHRMPGHLPQRHSFCTTPRQLMAHLEKVFKHHQKQFGMSDSELATFREKVEHSYFEFIDKEGFALKQEPLADVVGKHEEAEMAIPETQLRDPSTANTAQEEDDSFKVGHRYICVPAHTVKTHIMWALKKHRKHVKCPKAKAKALEAKITMDFVSVVAHGGFIIRESIPKASDYAEKSHFNVPEGPEAVDESVSGEPGVVVSDPVPVDAEPEVVIDDPIVPSDPYVDEEPYEPGHFDGHLWARAHHVGIMAGTFIGAYLMGYFTGKVRTRRQLQPVHPIAEYQPISDKTVLIKVVDEALQATGAV